MTIGLSGWASFQAAAICLPISKDTPASSLRAVGMPVSAIGLKNVARTAERMGIRTPISRNCAMTLGGLREGVTPLDMAHAYQTFATGGRFTHNAWLTRDGRYLFTTDERQDRPVEGWDLLNPMAPRKVAEYISAQNSIPHNVMVDGDRLLVAHYTEGVHLLDVRNPEQPAVIGFYDTYTDPPCGSFPFCGNWGAYIFPGSDLIVASDIQGGLFVIRVG